MVRADPNLSCSAASLKVAQPALIVICQLDRSRKCQKDELTITCCQLLKGAQPSPVKTQSVTKVVTKDELLGCQKMVDDLLDKTNANPVMVRLAWHDSGTFDASIDGPWPKAGGAIGSIMYKPEIEHGANAGLAAAVEMLKPIKAAYPSVSYADLFQMASARAIELAGGPKLAMR